MEFRIANTFTDSLARLTGDEQKAVKTTAFDLQLDPTSPGMSFHKLVEAKDWRFWSLLMIIADKRHQLMSHNVLLDQRSPPPIDQPNDDLSLTLDGDLHGRSSTRHSISSR
jgi:hypothetical protein